MEFFGITLYGPQNYFQDLMKPEYKEPMTKEEVKPMMDKIEEYSTLPKNVIVYVNVLYVDRHILLLL